MIKSCSNLECQQENPQSIYSFRKAKRYKDGLYSWCNSCWKEYSNNYCKQYYKEHKKEIIESKRIYSKNRSKVDIEYKLKRQLRIRLNQAIKDNYKTGSAVSDLGCSISELKIHLESKFQDGMTWENWGNKEGCWSIDHIIPLSRFKLSNRNEYIKACNYMNLQPLWHIDNLIKGDK